MENQVKTIKLNRFTSYIQQYPTHQNQSPTPTPTPPSPIHLIAFIFFYINQWLSSISDSITQTRDHWLQVASYWLHTPARCLTSISNFFAETWAHCLKVASHWLDLPGQWLTSLSNLFSTIFPPETRAHLLEMAAHYLKVAGPWLALFIVLTTIPILIYCLCLPATFCCLTLLNSIFTTLFNLIKSIFTTLFNLITSLFTMLFHALKGVFRCLSSGGKASVKMMIAPGTQRLLSIPRDVFESNPAGYFRSIR